MHMCIWPWCSCALEVYARLEDPQCICWPAHGLSAESRDDIDINIDIYPIYWHHCRLLMRSLCKALNQSVGLTFLNLVSRVIVPFAMGFCLNHAWLSQEFSILFHSILLCLPRGKQKAFCLSLSLFLSFRLSFHMERCTFKDYPPWNFLCRLRTAGQRPDLDVLIYQETPEE